MADWEPIRLAGKPELTELYEEVGTIEVHFPLSAAPKPEWIDFFEAQHSMRRDYPPLKVKGNVIVVLSRAERDILVGERLLVEDILLEPGVLAWVKNAKRDLERANSYYRTVLADRERKQDGSQGS
jgi:hypothetical protein